MRNNLCCNTWYTPPALDKIEQTYKKSWTTLYHPMNSPNNQYPWRLESERLGATRSTSTPKRLNGTATPFAAKNAIFLVWVPRGRTNFAWYLCAPRVSFSSTSTSQICMQKGGECIVLWRSSHLYYLAHEEGQSWKEGGRWWKVPTCQRLHLPRLLVRQAKDVPRDKVNREK